jgi:threonylcarbamoyladenosine tRNA methylthiotransferase MtaB
MKSAFADFMEFDSGSCVTLRSNEKKPELQVSKTFRIVTLGCKVNQYESACIREALLRSGWEEAPKGGKAEFNIVNTCIVTQRASYQSRQAIRRAIKENPGGLAAAVGCYAQVFPEELLEIKGLDLLADNTAKSRLPEVIRHLEKGVGPKVLSEGGFSHPFSDLLPISDRTRAMLKIQDGCDSFCTYCIVPYARGPVRSLGPERVIESLMALSERGYKEAVLTGIHLGRYGTDLKPALGLKNLLSLLGKHRPPLRIRLSSLEPKEVDPDIIEMVASEAWLCRHFHIPLQSGDDDILRRMNRSYSAGEFRKLIEMIRAKAPLAAVGADILAGFPGEDGQSYLRTYHLLQDLPLSNFHVFPFSRRKGTPASKFGGQVPQKEISIRTDQLRVLGEKKRQTFYESCVGKDFEVLTEGWQEKGRTIKGLTDNYLPVVFPSSQMSQNEMVRVRAERVDNRTVHGERKDREEKRV